MTHTPDVVEIRRALEGIMFRAAWREAGCTVVDTRTLAQVITREIPFPYANAVYRFVGDDLDRVLAAFGAVPFRFIVGPSARPLDLADQLAARGLVCTSELAAMWAPTSLPIAVPEGVSIEPLRPETIDEYCAVSAAGWSMSDAQSAQLRRSVERDHALGTYGGCLARIGGAPAGTGLSRVYDDVGYLQGSSVHPAFRGRGVYRALVAHRLRALRDAGVPVALIHARTTSSAPICEKLGFRTEFQSACFERR